MTTATEPRIPSMTSASVLRFLTHLGAGWRGEGVAVECGSWLGASTVALARGLIIAGYDRPFHCFDRWRATRSEVTKAAQAGVDIRRAQNLEPLFRANVEPVYGNLNTHRGWIHEATWGGDPIEFFLLDAAKREPAFSTVLRTFGPSWIPGATVVCLMDYGYGQNLSPEHAEPYRCQREFVARHAKAFQLFRAFPGLSPRFFLYRERIAW